MAFVVQKAVREKVYTKIAIMGSSGSGKSYSSLRLASGMADELKKMGEKGKILMINTEGSRGKYYADQFDYDVADMEAPYSPENYIEGIRFAIEEGYDILILDSISPEWEGKGGMLEAHALAGGEYRHWSRITPRHDKFIEEIVKSPIHIIATIRGKDQYEIDKDANGRTTIKKLGVGGKQREGFEYNCTCTFLVDQKTHIAEAQKDNTHLFDAEAGLIIDENCGHQLIKWANNGIEVPVKPVSVESPVLKEEKEKEFENIFTTVKDFAKKMAEVGRGDEYKELATRFLGEGKLASKTTIEDFDAMKGLADALSSITL